MARSSNRHMARCPPLSVASLVSRTTPDFFSLDAKKDQTLNIKLYAREVLRSSLDGVVNVYNAEGWSSWRQR